MKIKDTINGITIDLENAYINNGEIQYDKRNIKTIKNKNSYKNNKRK